MLLSEYAEGLASQLQEVFSFEDGSGLTSAIAFNARYIRSNLDDFASLLFIEFSECDQAVISLGTANEIVSRVQKRILRSKKRHSLPLTRDVEDGRSAVSLNAERITSEFVERLSASDAVVFLLRYVDGESVNEVCKKVGLKKTTVYERLKTIRQEFERFAREMD